MALFRCLGIEPAVAKVSHDFPRLLAFWGHGSTFVKVCGYNALCSSEGQEDFQLRRLSSLFGISVDSLIARNLDMAWGPLCDLRLRSGVALPQSANLAEREKTRVIEDRPRRYPVVI
ncbi:hypothetical protein TNCV_2495531 [Trichonephila clavipes]|nr:hypothetical protein TNCV_2495531 [Trichonephila clavipes]